MLMTQSVMKAIDGFCDLCEKLKRDNGTELSIGSIKVSVWKDGDYSELYDVHTSEDEIPIDDACDVHVSDLYDIIYGSFEKSRKFETL